MGKQKAPGPRWRNLSFFDNLAAAADAVGFQNADIALGIARVKWNSVQDREEFLSAITAMPTRDLMNESPNG